MAEFREEIRSGREPRKRASGRFFLREGDWSKELWVQPHSRREGSPGHHNRRALRRSPGPRHKIARTGGAGAVPEKIEASPRRVEPCACRASQCGGRRAL